VATDKVILREAKKTLAELYEKQFTFVEVNEEDTLVAAVSGSIAFVLIDTPKEKEYGTIALVGIAKVKLGGTVKAGERVASNNAGLGVAWASGQYVAGVALEKGESGQIISVFVPGPAKA
jgi:hypothetical protein